jgi:YggT family protein
VTNTLAALGAIRELLRIVLLGGAILLAFVAVMDWLVRTRRVGPFSAVARFFRKYVDPLLAPVERRVVRAGGMPASAPWWALAAVVVGGILLLALVDFIGGLVADASRGFAGGPAGIVRLIVFWGFALLQIAIMVRVIASWLPVNQYSPWLRWSYTLSEPILRPLRNVIPTIASIDITPIVAFFGIGILESLVRNWLG